MAIKLSDGHFKAAANSLKIHPAIVKTVAVNESKNAGFDDKGRPIILFERHKFYKYLGEKLGKKKRDEIARDHPDICNPDAGGYGKAGDNQWRKFSRAFAICKEAAMMSCSWGSFQEMGFNFEQIGFDTVDQFVDAMKLGLEAHLAIFIVSIRKKGLLKFLQKATPDFHNFAEGYNGSNQEQNDYEGKMRRGYNTYKKQDWDSVQALPLVTVTELKRRTLRLTTMLDDVPQANGIAPQDNADLDQQNNLNAQPDFPEADKSTGDQSGDSTTGEDTTTIQVQQVVPETESPQEIGGIRASLAGAVTFLTTTGAGVFGLFQGLQKEIVYGFFGTAALIGIVFTINRFWFANREKERESAERMEREKRAHELQVLTIQSAMNKNLNTVQIVPQPIINSEPATVPEPPVDFRG